MGRFIGWAIFFVLISCSGNSSMAPPEAGPSDSKISAEANKPEQAPPKKSISLEELTQLSDTLLSSNEAASLQFLQWMQAHQAVTKPKLDFAEDVVKAKAANTSVMIKNPPLEDLVLPSLLLRQFILGELNAQGFVSSLPSTGDLSAETAGKMMGGLKDLIEQRLSLVEKVKAEQGVKMPTETEPETSSGGLAYALCLKLGEQVVAFIPTWKGDKPGLAWAEVSQYSFPFEPSENPPAFFQQKKQALNELLSKGFLSPGEQYLKAILEKELQWVDDN